MVCRHERGQRGGRGAGQALITFSSSSAKLLLEFALRFSVVSIISNILVCALINNFTIINYIIMLYFASQLNGNNGI